MQNGTLVFENQQARITLSPAFEIKEMALKEEFEGTLSLKEAAEMALLLSGVKASAAYLLT